MTGLLGIRMAIPELVLFAITIPITAIYQIFLQWKFEKHFQYIDTSVLEEDVEGGEDQGAVTETKAGPAPNGVSPGNRAVVDDATGEAENTQGPRRRGQASMTDFCHPAVTAPIPFVWIPQDSLGMSKEEIRDAEAVGDIKITDGGATLDEKSKMAVLNWWRWTMQGDFLDG
jgi:hypothetical protein